MDNQTSCILSNFFEFLFDRGIERDCCRNDVSVARLSDAIGVLAAEAERVGKRVDREEALERGVTQNFFRYEHFCHLSVKNVFFDGAT